jgi:hypothetical protein
MIVRASSTPRKWYLVIITIISVRSSKNDSQKIALRPGLYTRCPISDIRSGIIGGGGRPCGIASMVVVTIVVPGGAIGRGCEVFITLRFWMLLCTLVLCMRLLLWGKALLFSWLRLAGLSTSGTDTFPG